MDDIFFRWCIMGLMTIALIIFITIIKTKDTE